MKKILVVDDDPAIVKVLELNLKAQGYGVEAAYDGKEALLKAEQYRPDLIILDIVLPRMSGTNVAMELKKNKDLQNIPVIFLSGLQLKEDEEKQGHFIGGNIVFAKPFNTDSLLLKIKELL